jgi:hypothetical protein
MAVAARFPVKWSDIAQQYMVKFAFLDTYTTDIGPSDKWLDSNEKDYFSKCIFC